MTRKMKDSGIEWIGKIPEDWNIIRLNNFVLRIDGGVWGSDEKNNDDDIQVIRVADFNREKNVINSKNLTIRNIKNISKKTHLLIDNQSDLLIEKSGGGDDVPVGEVIHFNEPINATFTNFIAKVRFDNSYINLNYITYVLSSMYDSGLSWKYLKRTTGIQNLDVKSYLNEKIPFPQKLKQNRIVEYLNYKTNQIDKIITLNKKSIQGFKSYKQSLITETVTKGLNPNVPMKDSGIEWIGKIPSNWNLTELKHVANLQTGSTPPTKKRQYFNGDIIWYKPGDLDDNIFLEKSTETLTQNALKDKKAVLFPRGTIYFVGIGTIGKIGYSKKKAYCNQQITALLAQNVNPLYLFYVMQAANKFIEGNALYTTLPIINNAYLKNIKIPLPSIAEQEKIVHHILKKLEKINHIIKNKQKLIQELQQYKQSLIYEYVTGKKEV